MYYSTKQIIQAYAERQGITYQDAEQELYDFSDVVTTSLDSQLDAADYYDEEN